MTDVCCCPPEARNAVCNLPAQQVQRPCRATNICPVCGAKGKPVQGQTVKALLLESLRAVKAVEYLFCRTQTCPVVYFSLNGEQTFITAQIRERVYQKEPESDDVLVCYCFRHSVGDICTASPATHMTIVNNISTGINAGQCACDLRNPQGACCLGNVRGLIKEINAKFANSC